MENLRLVLFVSLSFVSFLLWQAWQQDYGPRATQKLPAPPPFATQAPPPVDVPRVTSSDTFDNAPQVTQEPTADAARVSVVTDVFSAGISLRGGTLVEAALLRFPLAAERPEDPFLLLAQQDNRFFISQGGILSDAPAPTHLDDFSAERLSYVLTEDQDIVDVPLRWQSPAGVRFTKTFRFRRGSYLIETRYDIENTGSADWTGRLYTQLQREGDAKRDGFVYTFTGVALSTPEKRYEKFDREDLVDQPLDADIQSGWAAIIEHYFVAAIVPDPTLVYHYYSKTIGDDRYVVGMYAPPVAVQPGSTATLSIRNYVGPKTQSVLKTTAPSLELTVDYGVLWFIAKPLYFVLDWIHGVTGNWGWAIILLTCLVKGLFFPFVRDGVSIDGANAPSAAAHDGNARALCQRQSATQPGDDETLQRRENQSAGWLLSHSCADPGVPRVILGAVGERRIKAGIVCIVAARFVFAGSLLRTAPHHGRQYVYSAEAQPRTNGSHARENHAAAAIRLYGFLCVFPFRPGSLLGGQ